HLQSIGPEKEIDSIPEVRAFSSSGRRSKSSGRAELEAREVEEVDEEEEDSEHATELPWADRDSPSRRWRLPIAIVVVVVLSVAGVAAWRFMIARAPTAPAA